MQYAIIINWPKPLTSEKMFLKYASNNLDSNTLEKYSYILNYVLCTKCRYHRVFSN